ncbi:GDSL-type esterase/lipase family protein [Bradyrhizobium sp. Gha]|uniref:GDSL-type esterase/lipase family protein n=1 Tax=Bradyrhizobium sp. Gha TaxID=1855318 RepID=UPI0008EC1016|nr:GDSL-type esterase/lipase family protein [Bradyrhizobium sp. Gha]SFI54215.1 acyl-CoA thioesterase-1 [Bradyrhizobium sp. Gha]
MKRLSLRIFVLAVEAFVVASIHPASAQIVALGHSAVHGNVSESEMWPAVLERLLRARGSQVHVTNAGVWGETTEATLARTPSAVPDGTRLVILCDNPANDVRHNMSPVKAMQNIAAIKSQLKARGIRVIDVWGTYMSIWRQPDNVGRDGRHLSVEGNKKMAAAVVGMVR